MTLITDSVDIGSNTLCCDRTAPGNTLSYGLTPPHHLTLHHLTLHHLTMCQCIHGLHTGSPRHLFHLLATTLVTWLAIQSKALWTRGGWCVVNLLIVQVMGGVGVSRGRGGFSYTPSLRINWKVKIRNSVTMKSIISWLHRSPLILLNNDTNHHIRKPTYGIESS